MHELMINTLIFFAAAALLLYVILGGADYGAGILEFLPSGQNRERQKELVNHAMGPVWEANHMWLIILVVILFMGFPQAFQVLMVSLHLPLVALLIGIVIRGAVFTFRHYDAIQDDKSQKVYTVLFGLSSIWTSIWLGIIGASLFRGKIILDSRDFFEAYIAPWWGLFPLTVGIFTASIFAYLASIYLVGETDEKDLKRFFLKRAFAFNILVIVMGGLVFLTSYLDGTPLLPQFVDNPFTLFCLIGATLFFVALWWAANKRRIFLTRFLAAGQATLIIFGWYILHAPNVLFTTADPISFYEAAAPDPTLKQLCIALLVGSIFIFPSLFYLLKVFKFQQVPKS